MHRKPPVSSPPASRRRIRVLGNRRHPSSPLTTFRFTRIIIPLTLPAPFSHSSPSVTLASSSPRSSNELCFAPSSRKFGYEITVLVDSRASFPILWKTREANSRRNKEEGRERVSGERGRGEHGAISSIDLF